MINSLELFIKKKDAIDVTKKWLEARRSYLQKLKSQAGLIAGEHAAINDYAKSNIKLYKRVWYRDSEEDFFTKCNKQDFILCGDFHSSPSVKRFYVRLFKKNRHLLKDGLVMAVECFNKKDDVFLQGWLEQKISDEELLEKTNWQENWGFDWKSYKKLILEVVSLGFEVRAVNSDAQDFQRRDGLIAQNLIDLKNETNKQIFCLIGQHHLGPDNTINKIHLLDENCGVLCLHIDAEELYFALEEYNLIKDVQVLSLDDHYCFLSTPPWVHWQNHLLHLNGDDFDDDEEEDDFEFFDYELKGEDYNSVVFDYVQLLKKDLGIDEVLKPIDVAFIDEYNIEEGETKENWHRIMQPMLDSETSFYWPEQFEGIMVQASLNQAASVAGKYLHMSMNKTKTLPWGEPDSFEVWCWLEAVGHMLSKFINPKRANVSQYNLSAFLRARLGEKLSKELLKKLIRGRVLELDPSSNMSESIEMTWSELVFAARLKGALVGEGLFELYSKGLLSPEILRTYLTVSLDNSERFKLFYGLILQRLEKKQ